MALARIGVGILAFVAALQPVVAQPSDTARVQRGAGAADTVRHYGTTREVVVVGRARTPIATDAVQPTAVVTRWAIDGVGATDLSDAVARAPGVFVRSYGGDGGLRTISLRGTSAQQSVILLDGVRVGSSSAGAFDLGNIPAEAIDHVEVVRGGNSALYGASALGGVVNVVTSGGNSNIPRLRLGSSFGSFGERHLGLHYDRPLGDRVGIRFTGSYSGSNGDYPFAFDQFGSTEILRRRNADFTNLYGRGAMHVDVDDGLAVDASLQGYASGRGSPGAVVQGQPELRNARLDEWDLLGTVRTAMTRRAWSATFTADARRNHIHYTDPDSHLYGPAGIDSQFDRLEESVKATARRIVGRRGILDATLEVSHSRLDGDQLDPAVGAVVRRTEFGTALLGDWDLNGFVPSLGIQAIGALRLDAFSDLPPAVSPSLGIVVIPWNGPVRIRANAAFNYRAPSFTDQYYLNFGNTSLRPERSRSFDIGATVRMNAIDGTHSDWVEFEVSGFAIDTRDQILAVPKSAVSWSAQNIGRVLSRGIEASAAGTLFDGRGRYTCSYTLMRAEDRSGGEFEGRQLVYTPEELLHGLATWRLIGIGSDALSADVTARFDRVSHRFTLPLNEAESALPAYSLVGVGGSVNWNWSDDIGVEAGLDVSNVFDERYQVIAGYPMPERQLTARVEVRFQ